MRSGSGAGSYLRLIDFVYHSSLGLRGIKKKKRGSRTIIWYHDTKHHALKFPLERYLAHKKQRPLGPYGRTMPRALQRSYVRGRFLTSEVPLQYVHTNSENSTSTCIRTSVACAQLQEMCIVRRNSGDTVPCRMAGVITSHYPMPLQVAYREDIGLTT